MFIQLYREEETTFRLFRQSRDQKEEFAYVCVKRRFNVPRSTHRSEIFHFNGHNVTKMKSEGFPFQRDETLETISLPSMLVS